MTLSEVLEYAQKASKSVQITEAFSFDPADRCFYLLWEAGSSNSVPEAWSDPLKVPAHAMFSVRRHHPAALGGSHHIGFLTSR